MVVIDCPPWLLQSSRSPLWKQGLPQNVTYELGHHFSSAFKRHLLGIRNRKEKQPQRTGNGTVQRTKVNIHCWGKIHTALTWQTLCLACVSIPPCHIRWHPSPLTVMTPGCASLKQEHMGSSGLQDCSDNICLSLKQNTEPQKTEPEAKAYVQGPYSEVSQGADARR